MAGLLRYQAQIMQSLRMFGISYEHAAVDAHSRIKIAMLMTIEGLCYGSIGRRRRGKLSAHECSIA